jgi:hypothetical protein
MSSFISHLLLILKDSLLITSFVMLTMLIIEYLTVQTKGKWINSIKGSWIMQIIIASSLGVLPGCLGVFTTVSLYSHGLISFAALVASMIASVGDEAFVMFAMIPGSALKILVIVFSVGIVVGIIIHLISPHKYLIKLDDSHLQYHNEEPDCHIDEPYHFKDEFKNLSLQKVLLILSGFAFAFAIGTGIFAVDSTLEKVIYVIVTLVCVYIIFQSPDHFITEHIWEHIFKKHLFRIFLWTFGALLFIHFFIDFLQIEDWVKSNPLIILTIAVLIGIIPESGPHIIFISLFATGSIPLSILLANSIVQDGHGALPLLAESKRSFVALKLVNVTVGFLVGLAGYFIGF